MALEETIGTQGWQYIKQLVARQKASTIEMIHEPGVPKEFVSGLLRALDAIPLSAEQLIKKSLDIRKAKQKAEEGQSKVIQFPFVRPGSGTPAS